MDSALGFLKDHFTHGLCYPVWIEDYDQQFVPQNLGKSYAGTGTGMGLDNSLLSIDSDKACRDDPKPDTKTRTRHSTRTNTHSTSASNKKEAPESRDEPACADIAILTTTLREDEDVNDFGDLDEVIATIVRKRDELLKGKTAADEEIKRLRLEIENLKSLNIISKRIAKTQREEISKHKQNTENEISKHKQNTVNDKKKILELEKAFEELQTCTTDAKNALDGSMFLGGITSCDGVQRPKDASTTVDTIAADSGDGVLESFFGWTIDDEV
jgi:hypothetical protein